jgi:hypothetical protein
MSKRDISAGIRARQRSITTPLDTAERADLAFLPEETTPHLAVEVPAALALQIDEQVLRVNRAAQEAGRTGFTKRRFIELALRDFLRASPAEILARDPPEGSGS